MNDTDERMDETLRYVIGRLRQMDILVELLEDEMMKLGAIREKLADAEHMLRTLQGSRLAAARRAPEGG